MKADQSKEGKKPKRFKKKLKRWSLFGKWKNGKNNVSYFDEFEFEYSLVESKT